MTTAKLIQAIGQAATEKLVAHSGGQHIYIPRRIVAPDRDDNIIELFSESLKCGATCMNAYERCADHAGLTVRQVQRIVNE